MPLERSTRESVLVELGRYLLSAQQSQAIYPKDHPRAVAALRDLYLQTVELLAREGDLRFALADGEFIIDNEPLPIRNEVLEGLSDLFYRQGIGRMAVSRGVRRWELTCLVKALNTRAEADGGIEALLAREGVQHIQAAPLTGGTGTGTTSGGPTLSRAWEVYSASLENMRQLKSRLNEGIDADSIAQAASFAGDLADVVQAQPQAFSLLYALKSHDDYSYTHSLNVAMLSLTIARWLDLPHETLTQVAMAAILHDIGKVMVPDDVLNKPGKLDDEEWEIMQRHGDDGARLLLESPANDLAFVVAYEHQLAYDDQHADFDRWPLHLVSEVVCLADVYDALRSVRPYRGALPPDVTMRIMEKDAKAKFDADLFAGFRRMLGYYPPGTCLKLTDGRIAVARTTNLLDPERPRVLVVRGADGEDLEPPEVLDLAAANVGVEEVADPELLDIDPVDYL
ncbi:MAG TPA: HD domain-containing protein [Acidobacteriota bacterium]|nr:HD domain-containing protein [Acidobacteriota bacterium]